MLEVPLPNPFQISNCLTVTVQVFVKPPSAVLAVMLAVPFALAVTLPLESTVATEVLSEDHWIVWLVALDGVTDAVKAYELFTFIVTEAGLNVRPVTGTETVAGRTVTWQVAVFISLTLEVAVMVVVPGLLPQILLGEV